MSATEADRAMCQLRAATRRIVLAGILQVFRARVVHLRVAYTLWGAVTDPTALAELITRGIGPAKRYGCGLLVVASTDRSLR